MCERGGNVQVIENFLRERSMKEGRACLETYETMEMVSEEKRSCRGEE